MSGELSYVISVDDKGSAVIKKFRDGVEQTGRKAKEAEGKLASLWKNGGGQAAAGAAVAVTAVAAALTAGAKSAIDYADEMTKAAQKSGVTTEAFSSLAYAASLSDVEVTALTSAMAKLSKSMVESPKNLQAIGVEAVDASGNLRDTNLVMEDIAEKFSKMPDGAAKTAAAMKIFGKSGADMIPMLNSGAAGLREMTSEAERFGLIVNEKTAKAAEKFNDNITRLQAGLKGAFLGAVSENIGGVNTAIDELVKTTSSEGFKSGIANSLTLIADAATLAANAMAKLGNAFSVDFGGKVKDLDRARAIAEQLDSKGLSSKDRAKFERDLISLTGARDIGGARVALSGAELDATLNSAARSNRVTLETPKAAAVTERTRAPVEKTKAALDFDAEERYLSDKRKKDLDQRLETDAEFYAESERLEEERVTARRKEMEDFAAKEKSAKDAAWEREQYVMGVQQEAEEKRLALLQEEIGMAEQAMGHIASLLDKMGLGGMSKAFSIGNAALKVGSAFGFGGPAAGGLAILSALDSFGTGGDITGPSHSSGGVPILAEGGEAVIDKRRTAIAGGHSGIVNMIDRGGKSPTIVINNPILTDRRSMRAIEPMVRKAVKNANR